MTQPDYHRLALVAADTPRAAEAAAAFRELADWHALEEADLVVVLGGDGLMLQTLHAMLDNGRVVPAYGVNLGTVGFLMNRYRDAARTLQRIGKAKSVAVAPLVTQITTRNGERATYCAINEVSLLRETRQTAKIAVEVDGKVRISELVCDGVLLATPAGSTAYNYSANGPILPLGSRTLALTPINPFRPRRWRGAILPDRSRVTFRVLEPDKRPVSVVADQKEVRDVAEVTLAVAERDPLHLLFDPGHALDERIVAEQFQF